MGNMEKVHGRVAASGKGLEARRGKRALVLLVEQAPPPEFYPAGPIGKPREMLARFAPGFSAIDILPLIIVTLNEAMRSSICATRTSSATGRRY
jgi:hypothetical protein